MSEPTERDRELLAVAVAEAGAARAASNHPFGAVLAGADGEVMLAAQNTVVTEADVTGHAELNLVRAASRRFGRADLAGLTLYSSAEPCAMCAGGIYWSGPRVSGSSSERTKSVGWCTRSRRPRCSS